MGRATLALAFIVGLIGAKAEAQDTHLAYEAPTSHGATAADAILAGMDNTAAKLEAMNATGSRTTEHDVTWPLTKAEQTALGGWTVVLVSAVAADPSELPLTRVYLQLGETEVTLRPIAMRQVQIDPASRLAKRVGVYREDAFFLAPITALLKPGQLRADFAAHRAGFVLGVLPLAPPAFVAAAASQPLAEPKPEAVSRMLVREYKGFDGLSRLPSAPR